MLQLTKCIFIGCEHIGTNYSYCNLEGSKFISPPDYVNYFTWFGNILLSSGFANSSAFICFSLNLLGSPSGPP